MRDATQMTGQRMAAEYLRQLLLKPGPYRDVWQRRVARPRDNVINQLAVAEVISDHQRQVRGKPDESAVLPYQVRDVVSRALFEGHLAAGALEAFISAFGFSDEECSRLRRLLAGSSRIRVVSGLSAMPMGAVHELDAAIGQRKHHTVSLHDHMWVTSDGRIDRCRTVQVIEANAQGVDRIPFIYDTTVLTVEVGQGCKELISDVRRVGSDAFAMQILLAHTLDLGETLTLEYWVSYRYPGDPCDPGEREFRRGGMRQIDNLDMRIEFHPDRLPGRIWWAHWDGGDGSVLEREEVSLDIQHSAHRYLRSLEKTIVGFYWEWD